MSDDKQPPLDHAQKITAAISMRQEHRLNMATKRAQAVNEAGRFISMIDEDVWTSILERIANGETPRGVMMSLGFTSATLTAKRRRDADYDRRYRDAIEDRWVAVAEDIQNVTRGVEGYSSGDVRRDELIAKYDLALAKSFAPNVIAERQQVSVEHTIAPVVLPTIAFPTLPSVDVECREDDPEEG